MARPHPARCRNRRSAAGTPGPGAAATRRCVTAEHAVLLGDTGGRRAVGDRPGGPQPGAPRLALAGDIAKADCQLVLTGSGSAEVPADVEHINVDSRMDRRGGRTPGYRGAFSIRGSRRPFHADLHLGHQRRPEGGEVQPPQGCDRRRDDHAALQSGPRRRLLRLDAVVPFQRGAGRLGGGCGLPRLNGVATQIFGVAVPGRRPPLWRHLRQLRGQASFVCACDTGASRRRGQPAAGGVRQRGSTR